MPIDKGTYQGKLCSKNLDEAICILNVTDVLMEKTLMYIFSKKQFFEVQPCADPESYARGGPTLTDFFSVDEGRGDQHTNIGGPSSVHNGPTLYAGLVALLFLRRSGPVLLRNLKFCDFSGGGGVPDPLFPTLDTPMTTKNQC